MVTGVSPHLLDSLCSCGSRTANGFPSAPSRWARTSLRASRWPRGLKSCCRHADISWPRFRPPDPQSRSASRRETPGAAGQHRGSFHSGTLGRLSEDRDMSSLMVVVSAGDSPHQADWFQTGPGGCCSTAWWLGLISPSLALLASSPLGQTRTNPAVLQGMTGRNVLGWIKRPRPAGPRSLIHCNYCAVSS